jgi:quercetin dioxygenase-like cupin family protein
MKIFRDRESTLRSADPSSFLGPAATKLLATAEEGAAVHLYRVEFESGGRTNWHRHSGPQWLFIIHGRVRVQHGGQAAQDVEAGDAVLFAPGEKHWHGAAPGGRGAHLAVNINVKTDWLEPVTEEEYNATQS